MKIPAILASLCLLGSSLLTAETKATKPNIIVIYTDDHGYADLGCMGIMKDVKTPNIDSLAATGVRMTSGYVSAPQCGPSRCALISGQYQQRFGMEANGYLIVNRQYLFNLATDPEEKHNLFWQNPKLAHELSEQLKKWSEGLLPPGLGTELGTAGRGYFDCYLDGKIKPASAPKDSANDSGKKKGRKAKSADTGDE